MLFLAKAVAESLVRNDVGSWTQKKVKTLRLLPVAARFIENDSRCHRNCACRMRKPDDAQEIFVCNSSFDDCADTSASDAINTSATRWRVFRNCHQNQPGRPGGGLR